MTYATELASRQNHPIYALELDISRAAKVLADCEATANFDPLGASSEVTDETDAAFEGTQSLSVDKQGLSGLIEDFEDYTDWASNDGATSISNAARHTEGTYSLSWSKTLTDRTNATVGKSLTIDLIETPLCAIDVFIESAADAANIAHFSIFLGDDTYGAPMTNYYQYDSDDLDDLTPTLQYGWNRIYFFPQVPTSTGGTPFNLDEVQSLYVRVVTNANGDTLNVQADNFHGVQHATGHTMLFAFDDHTAVSGTGAATNLSTETTNVKFGDGAVKFDKDTSSDTAAIEVTGLDLDIVDEYRTSIWFYIPDATNVTAIQLLFVSSGGNWIGWNVTSVNTGWNRISFNPHFPNLVSTRRPNPRAMDGIHVKVVTAAAANTLTGCIVNWCRGTDGFPVETLDTTGDWSTWGGDSANADAYTTTILEGTQAMSVDKTGTSEYRGGLVKTVDLDWSTFRRMRVSWGCGDYASLTAFRVAVSDDGGTTWAVFSMTYGIQAGVNHFEFDPNDPDSGSVDLTAINRLAFDATVAATGTTFTDLYIDDFCALLGAYTDAGLVRDECLASSGSTSDWSDYNALAYCTYLSSISDVDVAYLEIVDNDLNFSRWYSRSHLNSEWYFPQFGIQGTPDVQCGNTDLTDIRYVRMFIRFDGEDDTLSGILFDLLTCWYGPSIYTTQDVTGIDSGLTKSGILTVRGESSQKCNPEAGTIEVGGVRTEFLKDADLLESLSENEWRGRQGKLYLGFPSLSWEDYTLLNAYRVKDIDYYGAHWQVNFSDALLELDQPFMTEATAASPVTVSGNIIDVFLKLLTSTGNGNNGDYDTLSTGQGVGFPASRVDMDTFEEERDHYFPTGYWSVSFTFVAPEKSFKTWCAQEIFKVGGAYLRIVDGKLSIKARHAPLAAESVASLSASNIVGIPRWHYDEQTIYNRVLFCYDYDHSDREFDSTSDYDDDATVVGRLTSQELFSVRQLQIKSKGIKTSVLLGMLEKRKNQVFSRYSYGPPSISLSVQLQQLGLGLGDVVSVTSDDIPDLDAGTLGIDDALMEIQSIAVSHESGVIQIKLSGSGYRRGRYAVIAPSSDIEGDYDTPGPYDVEYDGDVEPDADTPVWSLYGVDHASSDGTKLTISGAGTDYNTYFRVIAPSSGGVVWGQFGLYVASGCTTAMIKMASATLDAGLTIRVIGDSTLRFAGTANVDVTQDMTSAAINLLVYITSSEWKAYIHDGSDYVEVATGTPYSTVESLVVFGKDTTDDDSNAQYWDYVYYAAHEHLNTDSDRLKYGFIGDSDGTIGMDDEDAYEIMPG